MPGRAPASMLMLQTVMRPSIEKRADCRAGVLNHAAGCAVGADLADDGENDVLGRHAARQFALDRDAEGFGLGLRQRLRGQHVLDFAGADAEGQAPNAPCVAVWLSPQTIVMPGLVIAQLGTDDVDDALVRGESTS